MILPDKKRPLGYTITLNGGRSIRAPTHIRMRTTMTYVTLVHKDANYSKYLKDCGKLILLYEKEGESICFGSRRKVALKTGYMSINGMVVHFVREYPVMYLLQVCIQGFLHLEKHHSADIFLAVPFGTNMLRMSTEDGGFNLGIPRPVKKVFMHNRKYVVPHFYMEKLT